MGRLRSCTVALLSVVLEVAGGCGGGGYTPPQISVGISPITAMITTNGTQQFSATVTGTTNQSVNWSVAGGSGNGTITSSGLYTAPATVPNPAQITVMATSQADPTKSASAAVTITGITVQVLPATVTLQLSGTQQFSATVTGTTNQSVNWSVAGGSGNGTITSSGLYTAPAAVPNPAQVTVMATPQADTTKSGTATVTVIAALPSITVNPNPVNVALFTTQQFTAVANNLSSSAVTWQVNGVTGGTQQTGFISNAGLYVAPGGVPTTSSGQQSTPTTVTVTAISTVNTAVSGSSTVTVVNAQAQNSTSYLGSSGGNQKDSQTVGNSIYCCGGTLGSLVTRGGRQYLLSNNHVLAREDQGTVTSGTTPGDNIVQPGLPDINCGQGPANTVANLSQFYNLETGTAPKIDAAIAQLAGSAVDAQGRILFLGATTDANNVPVPGAPTAGSGVPVTVGAAVAKSGRTTGLTCSSILATNITTTVQYPKGCNNTPAFTVTYTDEIAVSGGTFSAPGDSGSLIVLQATADPVALLFAGSDVDTVGNPVADVLNYFKSGSNAMTFVGGSQHAVIGCSLPTAPALAVRAIPLSSVSREALDRATAVRAEHETQLMGNPGVQGLGMGASQDHPGEAAIVFFVTKGIAWTGIPQEVEGIRTRIVEGELFAQRGMLSPEQTSLMERAETANMLGLTISEEEYERAKAVHAASVTEWMSKSGVQGFGIGASADAPGEAALVIFLVRGVAHGVIPPVIEGVRTRVRESSPFVAGVGDENRRSGCSAPAAKGKSGKSNP